MAVDVFPWTKSKPRNTQPRSVAGTRKHKCGQAHANLSTHTREGSFPNMAFSLCLRSPIISLLLHFLLVVSTLCPVHSSQFGNHPVANQTFRPKEELRKLNAVRARLQQINKPPVKTIQSPDGDIIDCVMSHKQPAFDHPLLKGQKPLDAPERPRGHNQMDDDLSEKFQLWSLSGEWCPEGTIPIRRTREEDILRASSVGRFGMKKTLNRVRRDTSGNGHEHAIGYVTGDTYYGAKASINVWAPVVENPSEFSLSQMWVISGSFGDDLNTIEAGWQACQPGAIWGQALFRPTVKLQLEQQSLQLLHTKVANLILAYSFGSKYVQQHFSSLEHERRADPKHGNWWLEFGGGSLVGYWPSSLFSHLRDHASMIHFGGEIVNSGLSGSHTSTQMGSGHFAEEGFGKASYFRNMQVVDWDNSLIPLSNLKVLADHPNCYHIQGGFNKAWGNYFYYGGPGRNVKCP
ncbi:uncharacterized protein HKW66_Vig0000250 [Vigna angularis]|uniref:Neprosin PEP catalytic domain-containing protein n=1 Tax=Phaseolus angularis TaxID=3914 RepID=A0A8T0L933_PHAAN|nr:uncharacterized protein HKW66_Vig0000250 [Vigna angularis]